MADLITTSFLTTSIPSLSSRSDLATLVSAASTAIRSYCNNPFAAVTSFVEKLDGHDQPWLWLTYWPVTSISSVSVNGMVTTDYLSDSTRGRLIRGDGKCDPRVAPVWPKGSANIIVTYTGGSNTVPDDVKIACAMMCQWLATQFESQGLSSERIGDYSYQVFADRDPFNAAGSPFAALLSSYRRIVVA